MNETTKGARRRATGKERSHDRRCEVPGCNRFSAGRYNGKLACKTCARTITAGGSGTAKALGDDRPPTQPLYYHREPLPAIFADRMADPAKKSFVSQEWTVDRAHYWRAVKDGDLPIPPTRTGEPIPQTQRIGAALIGYAEEACGQNPRYPALQFAMPEVHHRFFLRAFEIDPDTGRYKHETSILSTGKKNMKSYSSATIMRACLDLPIVDNPYLMVGAPSILKCELISTLMKLYRQWPGWTRDSEGVGHFDAPFSVHSHTGAITKNVNKLWTPEETGRLDTFACGTGQQQQVAPNGLMFLDELGRMPSLELWEDFQAAKTASVSTPLIVISVLGSEHSPLDKVIRRAKKEDNGRVYIEMHQAPVDAPIDDVDAIRAANPCLDYAGGPVLDNILDRAAEARANPALVGKYKLEYLNLPANVTSEATLVTASEWERGNKEPILEGPLCIGLDLAADRDCAAVSFYDPNTYGLVSYAFFPGRLQDLHAREQEEQIPYSDFYQTGRFRPSEETSIDEKQVAATIVQYAERYGVTLFCIDPYLWKKFRVQLEREAVELLDRLPTAKLVLQGYGNNRMSPYVDAMRARCRDGQVHHGKCPMLRWGIVHTDVTTNSFGQAYFNKKGKRNSEDGKIAVMTDVLVSATLAVGALDAQEVIPLDVSRKEAWNQFREIDERDMRQNVQEQLDDDRVLAPDEDISDEEFDRLMEEI